MSTFQSGVYALNLTDRLGIGVTVNAYGVLTAVTGVEIIRTGADPNGIVTANPGSLSLQQNGAGSTLWLNTTVGAGTTWTAVGGTAVALLADNVVETFGTASPMQAEEVLVGASNRFDLRTRDLASGGAATGTAIRIATGISTSSVAANDSGTLVLVSGETDVSAAVPGGLSGAVTVRSGHTISTFAGGTSGNTGLTTVASGDSADTASGGVNIHSGTGGTTTGQLQMLSGNAGTNSGTLSIGSGTATAGISGNVATTTGSSAGVGPASGDITHVTGNVTGTGVSGNVTFVTGVPAGAGVSGDIVGATGNVPLAGTSGNVSFASGTTATGASGNTTMGSGAVTGAAGLSGNAGLTTGVVTTGTSGTLTLGTGLASGAGVSGPVNVSTGASAGGAGTGNVTVATGLNTGALPTGLISLTTGQTGTGVTGNVTITTGLATGAGTSGNVMLTPGTTVAGTRGHVTALGLQTVSDGVTAIAAGRVMTLADSGGVFSVSQVGAYDIDLPSPTSGAGCRYLFYLGTAAANSVTITVLGGAATFVGTIVNDVTSVLPATGATLTFVTGTAALGDTIEITSVAANLYLVRAVSSAVGGITIA